MARGGGGGGGVDSGQKMRCSSLKSTYSIYSDENQTYVLYAMLKIPESKQNYVPYSLSVRVRELDIAVSVWSKLRIADVPMQNHKKHLLAPTNGSGF